MIRPRLNVYRLPFLSLPPVRGGVVAWGGLGNYNGPASAPPGLGEAAVISAGSQSFLNCAIDLTGAVTIWGNGVTFNMPETNLISFVPWSDCYLGLRANGVVAAWKATSLAVTSAPAGLRDVVQLVGDGAGSCIAIHENGTIQYSYAAGFFPTNPSNVVQAALGQYHGVVLCGDGTVVMSTIDYRSRQTPAPAGLTNVVQVAAGGEHTLALKGDGTIVAWGRTNEGQCTVPAGLTNVMAVSAGANFSMALRANGTVAVWGDATEGETPVPAGLTNVAAIAAGYNYCLAIRRGPLMLSGPHDLNIAPGQVGTFEVVARGVAPLRYQWSFAGKAIAGATNSVLQITARPETEGLYLSRSLQCRGIVLGQRDVVAGVAAGNFGSAGRWCGWRGRKLDVYGARFRRATAEIPMAGEWNQHHERHEFHVCHFQRRHQPKRQLWCDRHQCVRRDDEPDCSTDRDGRSFDRDAASLHHTRRRRNRPVHGRHLGRPTADTAVALQWNPAPRADQFSA